MRLEPGRCDSCGLYRETIAGVCELCRLVMPEPIQTILPRVMARIVVQRKDAA